MWEFWRANKSDGQKNSLGTEEDCPQSSTRSLAKQPGALLEKLESPQGHQSVVHFKDTILSVASDDHCAHEERLPPPATLKAARSHQQLQQNAVRQKLIIVLVGLPARGKTFLCNKIMCYLNWLGHETRHFNIGQYRRMQSRGKHESHDASFFDHTNLAGREARSRALYAALDDVEGWLQSDEGQVAIVDATNSTNERRDLLKTRFHGRWRYLFLESIVTDPAVLEQNYKYKMLYSPDYRDREPEKALADFKERIKRYEEVYETITDRTLHYIKLTNMVTGSGHMDINRISGYIPGKIVFFLLQVCRASGRPRKIWLTRHGESEYNRVGKLGGDPPLSDLGQEYARMLPDVIAGRIPSTSEGQTMPVAVWTSTLQRTIQTAEHLPFPKLRWKVLDEIQAGIFDGWTYPQIQEHMPEEYAARKCDKLSYRYPSGESYRDVVQRLETVVIEIERERECVLVVGHQAVLRTLYGYFTDTPLHEIPCLDLPLHTLIELQPKPDGKMAEERIVFDMKNGRHLETTFRRVSSRQLAARSSMDVPFHPLPALPTPRLRQSATNPDLALLASVTAAQGWSDPSNALRGQASSPDLLALAALDSGFAGEPLGGRLVKGIRH